MRIIVIVIVTVTVTVIVIDIDILKQTIYSIYNIVVERGYLGLALSSR